MTLDQEIRKRGSATPGRYLKDTPLGTGGLTDWMNNPSWQIGGVEKLIGQTPFGEMK